MPIPVLGLASVFGKQTDCCLSKATNKERERGKEGGKGKKRKGKKGEKGEKKEKRKGKLGALTLQNHARRSLSFSILRSSFEKL